MFPWPPAEGESILDAVARTWTGSALSPAAFFRAMPRSGGTGAALLYFVPLAVVVAGIELFWAVVLGAPDPGPLLGRVGVDSGPPNPLLDFLLAPLVMVAGLFVGAAVTHAVLAIIGGARHGPGTTLRVYCYTYSPAVLAIVPWVGMVAAALWGLVIAVIGLREAHETTGFRAAAAILLPVVALFLLLALVAVLLVSGLLLLPAL